MLANPNQLAVLDFVRHGHGHGLVEATAGSGKTTTLVMVARLLVDEVLAEGERACFLAFNRSTAAELRTRLPARVEAATLHSLGRQVLATSRPADLELEPGKYARLARELLARPGNWPGGGTGGASSAESGGTSTGGIGVGASRGPGHEPSDGASGPPSGLDDAAAHLGELYGFVRLELTDPSDASAVAAVAGHYALRPPLPQAQMDALYALLPALASAGAEGTSLDFTDMIHLPLRLGLPAPRFAFICVDEAQDLSRMALGLVLALIEAGARALFVGDPYQAIYAFAGADARSLARVVDLTGAQRLPLSVSFRCPVRHVVLARRFSPAMLPAARAPEGSVRVIAVGSLPRLARPGDLVMGRTNAPLPGLALTLAAAGTPVRVLGHDLVGHAKELAASLGGPGSAFEVESALRRSADAQRLRLESELLTSDELPAALERSHQAHAALLLALRALGSRSNPDMVERLEAELDRLFAAEGAHVLLSTVHKAKGREAERTFLLFPELLGVGDALEADLAEANVLFVALTRAKRQLLMVEAGPGAIAARVRAAAATGAPSLRSRWDDVLRLALVMSRARHEGGLSSGHGEARRVQERGRQAGRGRRRAVG